MHTLVIAFVFAIAVMFVGIPVGAPTASGPTLSMGSAAYAQDGEEGEDGEDGEGDGESEDDGEGDGESEGDGEGDGDSGSGQTSRGSGDQQGQGKAWYQFW